MSFAHVLAPLIPSPGFPGSSILHPPVCLPSNQPILVDTSHVGPPSAGRDYRSAYRIVHLGSSFVPPRVFHLQGHSCSSQPPLHLPSHLTSHLSPRNACSCSADVKVQVPRHKGKRHRCGRARLLSLSKLVYLIDLVSSLRLRPFIYDIVLDCRLVKHRQVAYLSYLPKPPTPDSRLPDSSPIPIQTSLHAFTSTGAEIRHFGYMRAAVCGLLHQTLPPTDVNGYVLENWPAALLRCKTPRGRVRAYIKSA
jgi:hypothetical protein